MTKGTVFGGKKAWVKGDPDLNEALEKISTLQKENDTIDKERSLYYMELKQLQKDSAQMQESLDKEVQAHNFLQHLKIEHEEKIEKMTAKVN